MAKNPTKLSWTHDGNDTNGNPIDPATVKGFEAIIDNGTPVLLPVPFTAGSNAYELLFADFPALDAVGHHSLDLDLVLNDAADGTPGVRSAVSNVVTYDIVAPQVPATAPLDVTVS